MLSKASVSRDYHTIARRIVRLLLVLASSYLISCSLFERSSKISVRTVNLSAESDANSSSATRVEFIFLMDATLIDSLPATAPEWFELRDLLISNHSGDLLVSTTGLVPDTVATLRVPRSHRKARDLILYADYILPSGQKWYRVPNFREVDVTLKKTNLSLGESSDN